MLRIKELGKLDAFICFASYINNVLLPVKHRRFYEDLHQLFTQGKQFAPCNACLMGDQ
jgi:hypothetical protein